jgi:8-oxo-dGTP pyrophosphatase MutT (NUDIX family)
MSLLDRVRDCTQYDPAGFRRFVVDDIAIGHIRAEAVVELADFADVFLFQGDEIQLDPRIQGRLARTDAMRAVAEELRDRALVLGWRDELYPVAAAFDDPVLFDLERAAVPFFGLRGYGVHVNGWVDGAEGPAMWIWRRSLTKPTGPGLLDQMVAGGQPSGLGLAENVVKECKEEAGLAAELAETARPAGAVSYLTERDEGLRNDVLFVYDLELPADVTPMNEDGEVAEFMLWPMAKVMEEVAKPGMFKFNSALVVIDFLVRHGFVEPDRPGYTEIVAGLHR